VFDIQHPHSQIVASLDAPHGQAIHVPEDQPHSSKLCTGLDTFSAHGKLDELLDKNLFVELRF
jgi:hypothetical protein